LSSDEFRLAMIGTGGISRRHVFSLADLKSKGLDDFAVTAVCDINEESAQRSAQELEERFGLRPAIYTDYQELLSKEQVDGANLCLPHGLHHVVAIDCMEAGVHVLCEKPLGITVKASRKMAETADRTGCVLSTAVPYRRLPGQRTAHWILNESKLIGEPLSFFHQHARPPRRRPTGQPMRPALVWRLDRLMSGGGPVMDSGFHYCDSIRYLLGDAEKVYAEARELSSGSSKTLPEGREDTVFATLTFKSGVVGTWSWGLAAPGESFANVIFYGSEGSLRDTTDSPYLIFHLFWREARSGLVESGRVTKADGTVLSLKEAEGMHLEALGEEQREFLFPHGVTDGFTFENWEFMEVIRGNREKPEVDGWEGLRSLAICEAIYESALTGEVIRVDDVISGQRGSYQAPIDEHWGL
jgi:UDP-N-acetyl-2-amino-2-deoxyglucuronate dehydrogenase